MFVALLDSCVLWPSTQRDFLLSLAIEGAYRFIFSEAILGEVEVNEELKLVDRGSTEAEAQKAAQHLIKQMRDSFGDSLVYGWEGLEGTYGLPDPDDEHILAAAVVGGAGSIVTDNFKDFPKAKVPLGIQVISPQNFAYETVSLRPNLGLAAVEAMSARTGRKFPTQSPDQILAILDERYNMKETTDLIRPLLAP